MDWTITYAPGSALLLVSGCRAVLVPADTPLELRDRLWAQVQAGAGILDLLDALSEHGRVALSEAALVVEEEAGCVALLKGRMSAHHGGSVLDGQGRYTWTESRVQDDELVLMASIQQTGGEALLPIVSGVVPVESVRIRRGAGGPAVGAADLDARVPAPAAALSPDPAVEQADETGHEAETGDLPAVTPGAVVPAVSLPPATGPSPVELPGPLTPPLVAAGPDEVGLAGLAGPPSEPELAEEPGEDEDDYDRLFGVTSLFRGPASPPQQDQTAQFPAVAEVPLPESVDAGADGSPAQPKVHPAGPGIGAGAGLIDSVPGAGPLREPAAPPAVVDAGPSGGGGGSPGRTSDPGEADSDSDFPVVRQEEGSHPAAEFARATVGRLTLVSEVLGAPGQIDIDGSMVLGRRPSPGPGVESGDRLLTLDVPGGEVSRNHLRIGVVGWRVLVTDLGSTNGTVVTLPGSPPVRLREREPLVIVPNSVVEIADSISYRYEAT